MNKRKMIRVLTIVCLLVIIGCGGYLSYYYYTNSKAENHIQSLRQMIVKIDNQEVAEPDSMIEDSIIDLVTVDGVSVQKKFEKLYKSNKDFLGWLTIDDTLVDYPVMYTPNDSENGEYYIHRDFEGNYSAAGLLFIDRNCLVENPTDNIIIYGHNMNAGTMFHDILQYEDEDFYKEHKTFRFDTIYSDGTYEVVAAFYGQVLPEDSKEFKYYEFVNAGDKEEFIDYMNHIQNLSIYDTGIEVEYGDKLVTLSTCAYHVKDGRFAVIAKKIN